MSHICHLFIHYRVLDLNVFNRILLIHAHSAMHSCTGLALYMNDTTDAFHCNKNNNHCSNENKT